MNRLINVTTALGDRLRFSALSGREEISHLFDFSLTLKSEDDNLSTEAMLGTSVTLDIELPGGGMRYLNGQCVHFAAVGRAGRFHLYEARLKPWLWYATQRTDYRIFQQMTAPDMIRQVLADYPFEVRLVLSRSYRDWEYCVQYQESDANFVMRMMENEGIWFWFDHSAGEHALVLTDDIGLRDPFPGYGLIPYFAPDQTYPDRDHLDTWSAGQQVLSGQFMARDYNFTMPKADLAVIGNQQPGHAHDSYEHFEYPGGYDDLDQGDGYARVRMEALQSRHARGHAAGRARGLAPGWLFTLERHPVGQYNREYLIVAADYRFSDNDYEGGGASDSHSFRIEVQTHPSDQPFRPQRITPSPAPRAQTPPRSPARRARRSTPTSTAGSRCPSPGTATAPRTRTAPAGSASPTPGPAPALARSTSRASAKKYWSTTCTAIRTDRSSPAASTTPCKCHPGACRPTPRSPAS